MVPTVRSAASRFALLWLPLLGLASPGTLAAFAALLASAPLAAQQAGTGMEPTLASVPRFPVRASPIGLVADVRPREYLGVTGPRSAWLGTETGVGELWVHPLKVAREVQLSFKIPQYRAPLRGPDVASRVEVRPEGTTITYSHMSFTVKQHIVAPRDEPGVLMLLEVETFVPLEVWVSFRPELQYMWPGAFGGQ